MESKTNEFDFLEGRKVSELIEVLGLEAPADLAWITLGRTREESLVFLRLLPLPLRESIWIARSHWNELSPSEQNLRAQTYADVLFLKLEARRLTTVKSLDSGVLDPELRAVKILENALMDYLTTHSPDLVSSL